MPMLCALFRTDIPPAAPIVPAPVAALRQAETMRWWRPVIMSLKASGIHQAILEAAEARGRTSTPRAYSAGGVGNVNGANGNSSGGNGNGSVSNIYTTVKPLTRKYRLDLLCDGLSVLSTLSSVHMHSLQPCNHTHSGLYVKVDDMVLLQAAPYFAFVFYAIGKHVEANGSVFLDVLGRLIDPTKDGGMSGAPPPVLPQSEINRLLLEGETIKPTSIHIEHRRQELLAYANANVLGDEYVRRRAGEPPTSSHTMSQNAYGGGTEVPSSQWLPPTAAATIKAYNNTVGETGGIGAEVLARERGTKASMDDIVMNMDQDATTNIVDWEGEAEVLLKACGHLPPNETLRSAHTARAFFSSGLFDYACKLVIQLIQSGSPVKGRDKWCPPASTAGLTRIKDTVLKRYLWMCPRHAELAVALDKRRFELAPKSDVEYLDSHALPEKKSKSKCTIV